MDHIQNAKLTFELEIQALENLKDSIGDDFKRA
ncbi:D-arabinose 5-phosphate isomerase, partial [Francisella noatunensis subsp. orientalis]|nr:D-arabinose 5-phosphate isomerase [Francisella orientalis]NIY58707.1 D-arabinose 5-phosphate isomerase [Francisella orientalis]